MEHQVIALVITNCDHLELTEFVSDPGPTEIRPDHSGGDPPDRRHGRRPLRARDPGRRDREDDASNMVPRRAPGGRWVAQEAKSPRQRHLHLDQGEPGVGPRRRRAPAAPRQGSLEMARSPRYAISQGVRSTSSWKRDRWRHNAAEYRQRYPSASSRGIGVTNGVFALLFVTFGAVVVASGHSFDRKPPLWRWSSRCPTFGPAGVSCNPDLLVSRRHSQLHPALIDCVA